MSAWQTAWQVIRVGGTVLEGLEGWVPFCVERHDLPVKHDGVGL